MSESALSFTIRLKGQELTIEDLELGELELLEDAFGKPWMQIDGDDLSSARGSVYVIYLIQRRKDPTFTLEQARQTKIDDLLEDVEAADEDEPEDAEGNADKADAEGAGRGKGKSRKTKAKSGS